MVNSPSADQLLALNALLQQTLSNGADDVGRALNVNVVSSAVNLDNLSRLTVLEGTALAADLDQILLKTAQGDFVLKAAQAKDQNIFGFLPARVTLQLRPGPDGMEAVLVIGNKPINKTQDSLSAGSSLSGATRQTLAPEVPKIGAVHEALVIPSSLFSSRGEANTPRQGGNPQDAVKATAELTQNIAGGIGKTQDGEGKNNNTPNPLANALTQKTETQLPKTIPPQDTPDNAEDQPQQHEQNPQNARNQDARYNAPRSSLPQPQETNLKIISVFPSEQKAAASAIPVEAKREGKADNQKTLTAIVRDVLPSGQPVLEVGDKMVAVKTARNWAVGTQMLVQLGKDVKILSERELTNLEPRLFESLREGLQILAQNQQAPVRDVATTRMPHANAQQMGGALLFFLNAMQRNDFNSWLGPDFSTQLENLGRIDLIKKIQEEWQGARTQGYDMVNGEWKGFTVPYLDQDKVQHFRFYVHDQTHKKEQEKNGGEWARRFLVEVALSRLGPLQMEGLVQKKKLDLIVRSDAPLEESLKQDLNTRFAAAMEEVRYAGTLLFRANKQGWIDMKQRRDAAVVRNV